MLDLVDFPLNFIQVFIIATLENVFKDLRSKLFLDFLICRFCIFDGIV